VTERERQAGLVSVIVPVFNRPRGLVEAVESVLVQAYRPVEVIVVDDGSTDDTGAVATRLAAQHDGLVRVARQENAGPGVARETGRRLARGELVQHLDSDDVLLPRKLELQVAALRAHPECGVAYGMTRFRHADGRAHEGPWKGSGRRVERMFPSFLRERWWDTPNPLYRASLLDAAGPWSDLRLEEDWEYDCRVAALGVRLCFVPEYVCEVRDHDDHRLSRGSAADAARNRERARAHALIFEHARRAGIASHSDEMRHFARELFLLARQCGACGLAAESRLLFALAREASTAESARGADFRLYRFAAALLGWAGAGRVASLLERLRGAFA
jgi:glycosyltransferase involved in cell wall biosynthesis